MADALARARDLREYVAEPYLPNSLGGAIVRLGGASAALPPRSDDATPDGRTDAAPIPAPPATAPDEGTADPIDDGDAAADDETADDAGADDAGADGETADGAAIDGAAADTPVGGTLYVVATPIGNLGDISRRAAALLARMDVVACEDTRRTRVLLNHLGAHPMPRLVSYREHQEQHAGPKVLQLLQEGRRVALCSDGGYPSVSDPGYRLVNLALDAEVPVTVLPGAGAVETALVISGLPTSSYTFKGFPPRKSGALRRFFAEEAHAEHTLVLFESPFRVGACLAAAAEVLGDRRAAVCIELTKKFERVSRGHLSDLAGAFEGRTVKGEVTIVIAGNHPKFTRAPATD
jgi:16S rRNA (cytidine1402-2'-O)-methyltransferase